jgi:AraC-like DNA-binding protein
LFAAGLALAPAKIEVTGDSCFAGIRLWPWAWTALGGAHPASFLDRWIAVAAEGSPGSLLTDPGSLVERLGDALGDTTPPRPAQALLQARTPAEAARTAEMSLRSLQRWCRAEIGLTPQAYLRLLRLDRAMRRIQSPGAQLAGEAAELGYADQPHMNRDFRDLAHSTPLRARAATGPFLGPD